MGNLGFDATEHDPATAFEPVPPGVYTLIVKESTMKATKDGDGEYLALTFEIVEGQYKGRQVFENLNLVNKNADAVRIAQGQLSALCHATGKLRVKDSSELHGIPFLAELKVIPAQNGYDPKNRVKKYLFEEDGKKAKVGRSLKGEVVEGDDAGEDTPPWMKQ